MYKSLTLIAVFQVILPFLGVKCAVSLREPVRNSLYVEEEQGTLDKVKVIGHMESGRCLVIENGKRQGSTRENQLVLWKCHDPHIKGLEQEMFILIKSNNGGYLVMGDAGNADKCISADRNYYDQIVTKRCDPFNADQSWLFRRVEGHKDKYQMVHMSTGRCVRAPGLHDGAWVRVGDCELEDSHQMWQICGLDGSCDF